MIFAFSRVLYPFFPESRTNRQILPNICVVDDKDDKNDKSTVVKYLGIEKSKEYVKELTAKAVNSLKDISGDTSVLEQIALLLADRTY